MIQTLFTKIVSILIFIFFDSKLLRLHSIDDCVWSVEHCWNDNDRGNQNTYIKMCPSTAVSTKISHGLAWDQTQGGNRPATNCLRHGMTDVYFVLTVTCRLTALTRSEKCVVRRFRHRANVIECTYTHLDSIAYYTPRLYGMVYCC